MDKFKNTNGKNVLLNMVRAIQDNKGYLGKIDGLIGDGDHGANMNKGFSLYGEILGGKEVSLSEGLSELGTLLFKEIGGSMGPIYGTIFNSMSETCNGIEEIGTKEISDMLESAMENLFYIVDARPGNKTLVDTLAPAVNVMKKSLAESLDLRTSLGKMKEAAIEGENSTKDMKAVFGRSARLGERSIGFLDAGAVSCRIILCAFADGIIDSID